MTKRDPVLTAFGQNVRKRREARHFTQEALTERAELDRTYISDIERGTRNPCWREERCPPGQSSWHQLCKTHGGRGRVIEGRPSLNCMDLFCGCGGFSLGMRRVGFSVLAAIDLNAAAIATLDRNFPDVPFVLHKDLTAFGPEKLAELIWAGSPTRHTVDVVAGGPPTHQESGSQLNSAN